MKNQEIINITAEDFIESPEGQKLVVPTVKSDSLDNPAFRVTFNVDDHIQFNITNQIRGTGTVLGLALDHIIKTYIVLLDEPIQGQKAILCSNTSMKLLTPAKKEE
jgi:hypothetical protein